MKHILPINEGWAFVKGCETAPAAIPAGAARVDLPHCWNALDGQDGGSDYWRGPCCYLKTIEKPAGKNVYVEVEAASSVGKIIVNGVEKASHKGGYSLFRANVTDALHDGENLLAIWVDNTQRDDVYPQTADFTFYGGLYRGVNLITVEDSRFDLDYCGGKGFDVSAAVEDGAAVVSLDAFITNPVEGQSVEFIVRDAAGVIVAGAVRPAAERVHAEVRIENAHLWQGVKDPYLYAVEALLTVHNETIDNVSANLGVRTYTVDPQKGFFLNGVLTPLRGVSRHQDRLGQGNALTKEQHEEDVAFIREVGANTVRLAHYQHSPYFYDACDRAGLVVWAEIPFISVMNPAPGAHENCRSQMKELIVQNYNHPSICFWGISNEISIGGESEELLSNLHALNDLVHELDQTRLTTMANLSMVENDSPLNHITDVISYNHYFGWYLGKVEDNAPWLDTFHAENPEICLGISEYGCEGITTLHSASPKVRDYSEEYQAYYHEKMLETFAQRPYLWSTHVWNMFDFASDMRDEGGVQGRNNKGLVTFDRQTRKDSFYIYKAYWTKAPFVHICSRRFKERAEETVQVKVYSNCEQVSLKVNGKKTGSVAGKYVFTFDRVPLTMGENIIQAAGFLGQQEVCCESIPLVRVTEPNASYMLAEEAEKAGQNVENWFAASGGEGEEPLQFPEGYFSIKDKVGALLKNLEGEQFVSEMIGKVMPGMKVSKGMLNMAKHFTIEKVIEMAGDRITPEMVRYLNQRLNQIKK